MRPSRAARALTSLTVAAPLGGALLVLAAPAAQAAVLQPGDGAVYTTEDTTVQIRAGYAPSTQDSTLSLTSPTGATDVVASARANSLDGGMMAYDLALDCWSFPSPACTGRQPAPNGTWTIKQSDGSMSSFTTRVAPAPPTGVSAAGRSLREAEVTWTRGAEPDLTGYAVYEGEAPVRDGLGLDVCDGAGCRVLVGYGEDRPGEHTYTVRALRSVGPGSPDVLASPASSAATANLSAPPPSPASTPSSQAPPAGSSGPTGPNGDPAAGGAGASPGTGASPAAPGASPGSPGSSGLAAPSAGVERAFAQRRAFSSGFSDFAPTLGIPKLPPLPQSQSQSQSPAIAAPLPDGTFAPTLGFPDQVVRERVETQGPAQRVTSAVGSALDSERLVRSTAGALVLLMAGAHLRRWLGASAQD